MRLLLLCLLLNVPAFAQDARPNGYETLVAAGKLILPGENGSPSELGPKLAPAENLRRQRLAVARNAPSLKLLREALELPIAVPLIQSTRDIVAASPYASFRELARQLCQESDVRAADGDWMGALDSRLTAIQLGVSLTRDAPYIVMLVGAAIEGIGRQDLDKIVAKLDASSTRNALNRLKSLGERRATFVDVLGIEKATSLKVASFTFGNLDKQENLREELATPEGRAKYFITEAQAQEILAMKPESIKAELEKSYDEAMARDKLPYIRAKQIKLSVPEGKFAAVWSEVWRGENMRFSYERNLAEHRLLEGALELHALKLETGAYPETFEAPPDPFGDGTRLIYERDGDGYMLYSIGPDGKDDGGAEIMTLETQPETGAKSVSEHLRPNSFGDIVAPIF